MSDLKDFVIENGVLKKYVGNGGCVAIPDGVTSIGNSAFEGCKSLTSITIPDSVTSIGNNAFAKCSALTSVVIPDSVTKIGYNVFNNCTSLETVTLSKNLTILSPGLFQRCSALKDITLPNSIIEIGDLTFCGCESLTTIVIPAKVKEISISAFTSCTNLCSLTLPEDIEKITKWFVGCPIESCTALNHLNCINNSDRVRKMFWQSVGKAKKELFCFAYLKNGDAMPSFVKQYVSANLQRLVGLAVQQKNTDVFIKLIYLKRQLSIDDFNALIPLCEADREMLSILLDYKNKLYSTEDIDAHETDIIEKDLGFKKRTLADWKKIYQLVVEDAITIKKYKGSDTEIIIPEEIEGKPVVAIDDTAFAGKPLTSIVIPECIKTIGTGAFRGCTALITITLPKDITILSEGIFKNCTSLTNVKMSETITTIGHEAFRGCTSLSKFNVPKQVTEIGDRAFWGCTALTDISYPDQLLRPGSSMFRNCKSLTAITIPGSVTSIGHGAFSDCNKAVIHAPAGSYAEQYAKRNNIPFVAE